MLHLGDAEIERLVTVDAAIDAIDGAFRTAASGGAAVQRRIRTDAGPIKLSTLGAILPKQGFAGAKIYTTIGGRFSFVIALFSAEDGRPLATLDGGALTRLRTAATSAVAARTLARSDATVLAVFGSGVQAAAHVPALLRVRPLREVRVASRSMGASFAESLQRDLDITVQAMMPEAALDGADIVLTATRSATPLFDGALLPQGAFIAAVGSSRPDARELDDAAIRRCASIVVEWKAQARDEAGDLVAARNAVDWSAVRELGAILVGLEPGRQSAADIILFKSVGIGLEDIALAGIAYRSALDVAGRS